MTDAPVLESHPPAIRVRHLWHAFGGVPVVRDVSFDVGRGEIFGFIGPNGAGKTTTIRIMATLLEPTAGLVEIDGIDVTLDPGAVRRVIGYMPDHAGVYERIAVREYLEFFAAACQVSPRVVGAVIELTELGDLKEKLVASLSKGMRQRLQLARVLLHDPKVLVMDEPASDLDPRARIEIRDLLVELRGLGKTIFLSSHILSELSDVCSSIGIIEKGKLLVSGPIGAISEQLEARRALSRSAETESPTTDVLATEPRPLDVPGSPPHQATPRVPPSAPGLRRRLKLRTLADSKEVAPRLSSLSKVAAVEPGSGGWLVVHHSGDDRFVADVVRTLVESGVPVVAVEPERNELERIFLEVTKGSVQ